MADQFGNSDADLEHGDNEHMRMKEDGMLTPKDNAPERLWADNGLMRRTPSSGVEYIRKDVADEQAQAEARGLRDALEQVIAIEDNCLIPRAATDGLTRCSQIARAALEGGK